MEILFAFTIKNCWGPREKPLAGAVFISVQKAFTLGGLYCLYIIATTSIDHPLKYKFIRQIYPLYNGLSVYITKSMVLFIMRFR